MNCFCSIFSQLLQLFPRTKFQEAIKKTKAERHARGFTCWGQFVAMLFCQLGRAHSLREITGGLRSCGGVELRARGFSKKFPEAKTFSRGQPPFWKKESPALKAFDGIFWRIVRGCEYLSEWNRKAVSWLILPLPVIITEEVIMRYGFSSATVWAFNTCDRRLEGWRNRNI